jgi:hypothetical protein
MHEKNRARVLAMSFASVYPMYVKKAEAKGRSKDEVDAVLRWLTGYSQAQLEAQIETRANFEAFINEAPAPNPARTLITGMICGYRVEAIEDDMSREIRYIDKVIDELAKGKPLEKIMRKEAAGG